MPITVDISDAQLEAKLREQASREGLPPEEYARRLVREAVQASTVDEVLAPFREQVAASGLSDEELDGLLNEIIRESRDERRARHGG